MHQSYFPHAGPAAAASKAGDHSLVGYDILYGLPPERKLLHRAESLRERLKLSTLTVLNSCLAAALVARVVGAIAILPIVASYPVIERIWPKPYLERDTVATHEAIDAKEHPET